MPQQFDDYKGTWQQWTADELAEWLKTYSPRTYSGRGMDGAYCFAVELHDDETAVDVATAISQGLVWRLGDALYDEEGDSGQITSLEINGLLCDVAGFMEMARTDHLGQGTILYWPRLRPAK